MKKLLFLLILIVAVAAAVPYAGGYYFKREYLAVINNMNNVPQWPKVTVVEYRMGWLSSHVKLKVTPPQGDEEAKLGNLDFSVLTIDQTITHGPVVFSAGTPKVALATIASNIHLPAPFEQILIGSNPNGIAQVNSVIKMDGDWSDSVNVPAFTVKQPGMGELVFNGLTGDVRGKLVDNQIKMMNGNLKIGEIKVTSDKAATQQQYMVTIKPITVTNEAMLEAIGLWSGKGSLKMPSMSVEVDGNTMMSILNLGVNTHMDLNGGKLYSVGEKVSLDKVNVPGVMIPEVGPALFKFDINNIDANGLLAFIKYTDTLNDQMQMGGELSEDQQQKMLQLALQMIDPSTSIQMHISGDTSDGAFTSDAVAKMKQGADKPKDMPGIMMNSVLTFNGKIAGPLLMKVVEKKIDDLNQAQAMMATKAGGMPGAMQQAMQPTDDNAQSNMSGDNGMSAEQQLPQSLQDQSITGQAGNQPAMQPQKMDAKSMISAWIAQGLIKQEGNDYLISIEYRDGAVMVNGQPMQALNMH